MSRALAERQVAAAAPLFAALGDPTRLVLLRRLSDGPASISALAASLETMTRQGVSKHLNVLAEAGVIEGRREGREHIWAVSRSRIDEARQCLDVITRGWDDALGRLKAHVETGGARDERPVPPARRAPRLRGTRAGRTRSRK